MNAIQVQDAETATNILTEDIEVGIGKEEDVPLHLVRAEVEVDIAEDTKEAGKGTIDTDTEEEEKELPRIPDQDLNSLFLPISLIFLVTETKAKKEKAEDLEINQGKDRRRAEVSKPGRKGLLGVEVEAQKILHDCILK